MVGMNQLGDYVTVKILFFARAREFTGESEVFVKVPSLIKGKDFLNFISEKYNFEELKCNVILALNENWIDLNSHLCLKNADEIAVIPPLSGEFGAVALFIGTTRNNFEGKIVCQLEYEAYEGMAIKSLENICQNIRNKFDVGNIAIYHRLGEVPVQEASVIIAISSIHRKPALEAVPFAIDALKADVPIWKKEVYKDEKASQWKENSESEGISPSDNTEIVQLYEEVVEADFCNEVPAHLIQINANLQEINRRINSFVNRKREQINVSNVQDFCLEKSDNANGSTCARVSAVLIRRKDSKSHLKGIYFIHNECTARKYVFVRLLYLSKECKKSLRLLESVHRVQNCVGPQTHGFDPGSYSSSRECSIITPNCPSGAEERLANAECYLNVNQTSKNVFSRLKAIEDKILFLESISPEYFDFDRERNPKQKPGNFPRKRTYSSSELDLKMQLLEAKLQKKSTAEA